MRVGYARVSTTDQSPELQLDALRRAGCEKIHTEKASGAKADRPELARVLDDVLRQGDVLVVWRLDRLARSLKKLITTAEDLEQRGIGLVSLTESIDTTTPGGVLVFHVFGAIAQFERAPAASSSSTRNRLALLVRSRRLQHVARGRRLGVRFMTLSPPREPGRVSGSPWRHREWGVGEREHGPDGNGERDDAVRARVEVADLLDLGVAVGVPEEETE